MPSSTRSISVGGTTAPIARAAGQAPGSARHGLVHPGSMRRASASLITGPTTVAASMRVAVGQRSNQVRQSLLHVGIDAALHEQQLDRRADLAGLAVGGVDDLGQRTAEVGVVGERW